MLTLLEQKLGPDLKFLAPALAQGVLDSIQESTRAAIAPLEQQLQSQQAGEMQRQQTARAPREAAIREDLDSRLPGWEDTYGQQLKHLESFLRSDALEHPDFGTRQEVYLRLLNPGMAARQAVDALSQAGRNRVSTGRPGGQQSQGNTTERIKDINLKQGWAQAWNYAIKNIDTIAEEMGAQIR